MQSVATSRASFCSPSPPLCAPAGVCTDGCPHNQAAVATPCMPIPMQDTNLLGHVVYAARSRVISDAVVMITVLCSGGGAAEVLDLIDAGLVWPETQVNLSTWSSACPPTSISTSPACSRPWTTL